jgi:two-component system sensor histidine kinase PilS (NtrC family)
MPVAEDRQRRAERRRTEHRRAEDARAWEVPGFGSPADTAWLASGDEDDDRGRVSPDWQAEEADTRFLSRQARRLVRGSGGFDRIYRAFVAARAGLGLALVLAQGLAWLLSPTANAVAALLCVAYAAQALALWLLPRFGGRVRPAAMARPGSGPWLGTIGVDLLAFSLLHLLSRQGALNYTPLLVLPLLMAGVLTPRLLAMGTASAVALMLLGAAWRGVQEGGEVATLMAQAGLAGIGFFVLTLLAGELAGRLAREERTARGSMALARQQAQLNRLVIEQMHEGVMVVDRRGRVRTANPAARLLLGEGGMWPPAPFALDDSEAWRALRDAVQQAFAERAWPTDGRELTLRFADGGQRTVVARLRFTPPGTRAADGQAGELLGVLFLEDLRQVQARTRDAKLAAMGRMSAGIAHEIRNPLAAITQANALLEEDALSDGQRLLTRMVGENAQRLKRIVDDVMEVAPGVPPVPVVFDACEAVAAMVDDWRQQHRLPADASGPLQAVWPPQALPVRFEPEHLRRVLVNLLDNGLRHASGRPASVRLRLEPADDGEVRLAVRSDGEPIAPEVERYLFEPFYSTRSRGTGLGLYICRELCGRYGARIDYRLRDPGEDCRNEFVVLMRGGEAAGSEATSST